MTAHDRRRQPHLLEYWGLAAACGLVLTAVLITWAAGSAGEAITGHPLTTANPFNYVARLALGRTRWPGTPANLILAGIGAVTAAAVAGALLLRRRLRKPPTLKRIHEAAKLLATPEELHELSPQGVAASAARLRPQTRVDPRDPTQHGRLIGHTLLGDIPLRSSWEELGVHIWGARRGKTSSQGIPNVVEAPGAVVSTSNRRDVVDATRGPRARRGDIWIFDPQQVATAARTWWYNPLSRITTLRDAEVLTSHFVFGTREHDAKTDAYFDGTAEGLLAAYFYAAAKGGHPIGDVYDWAANSRDQTPLRILRDLGQDKLAHDVQFAMEAPEKQRDGIYGTTLSLLRCLRDLDILAWVTPHDDLPEFRADEFAATTDTLYALSMEGAGSAGPLTSALTDHVCHAGVERSSTQTKGRLDPPLYVNLDEAANVVRWKELPNLYSHFGGRGITIDTILQSWPQGVRAWGKTAMEAMWQAANIRTYGGGGLDSDNSTFLRTLSEMLDDYDQQTWSTTLETQGRRSHQASGRQQRIMPPALLARLPRGYVLLIAAGAPPTLLKTQPWWHGPHAHDIQRSIDTYDPAAHAQPATPTTRAQ